MSPLLEEPKVVNDWDNSGRFLWSFREAGVMSPNFTEEKSERSPVHTGETTVVHHTGVIHHFTHVNLYEIEL